MGGLGNKQVMAKNIQKRMNDSGIDRNELCRIMGVPYSTVSDWLNAKTYPRIDKIEMMANYFGISKADMEEDGWQSCGNLTPYTPNGWYVYSYNSTPDHDLTMIAQKPPRSPPSQQGTGMRNKKAPEPIKAPG